MAQFASDSFAGTAGNTLPTYSSSWTKHANAGAGTLVISDASRVRCTGVNALYYHSATPPSADYSVKADLYCVQATDPSSPGVCGRVSTSATTYYHARFFRGTGWQLYKVVGGTFTQFGSSVSQSMPSGVTYEVLLRMEGTSIELYKEGSSTATISATDSAITAAGKVGLRDNISVSNTEGIHVDNFSADDFSVGYTHPTLSAVTATEITATSFKPRVTYEF